MRSRILDCEVTDFGKTDGLVRARILDGWQGIELEKSGQSVASCCDVMVLVASAEGGGCMLAESAAVGRRGTAAEEGRRFDRRSGGADPWDARSPAPL